MNLRVFPSSKGSAWLTLGRTLVFLALALLACIAIITVRGRASHSKEPNFLLAQADHFAWLWNWERAGELYQRAEELAVQQDDKRDQLYATCGRLRATIGSSSILQTSATLAGILRDPIAANDPRLRIRCLASQGDLLREDHPDSSRQAWQEVLELAQRLRDKPWQTRAQAELAIISFMDGDSGKARKLLSSALSSAVARGDLPTLVYYASMIGTAFAQMGRAGEALEYCGAALRFSAMFKDMGFPFYAYARKGQAFTALGRLDEARNVLTQTLDKTRQLDLPLEQTQILIAIGKLEVQAGRPPMAAQYFEEAGSLSRKDGFIHSIAWSMYEAARVYRDEGRYADAERCESEAMSAMHEVADEYHLPLHLTMLADLKAKEGDPAKAQELYEQAADVVDTLLANSPSEQLKSSLISTVSETYKGNFSVATELGQTEEAFSIVEAARGRSIADLLSRPRSNQDEPPDSLRVARVNLNGLQHALLDTSDRSNLTALQDRLLVAEQLAGSQSEAADAKRGEAIQTQNIHLASMRAVLLPDELLLEYVLAEPTSFCLAIDQKHAVIIPLPAGGNEIEQVAERYLGQISAAKNDDADARKLYDLLLGPFGNFRGPAD